MPKFVDTNLFLRFLTNDIPQQAKKIEGLLKRAEKREIELFTSDLVIAEIAWTLESFYRQSKEEIAFSLRRILVIENLKVPSKENWLEALEIFLEKNLELIDAFNYSLMLSRKIKEIYTSDKHFDKLRGIKRVAL